ncbi:MAG: hypothetical protein QXX33_00475 [Candidatus Hadarchaeales archaeon]
MVKYTIEVDDKIWKEFKKIITKDKTINQAIVELIVERVKKHNKEVFSHDGE